MTTRHTLRPDLDQGIGLPSLSVTGVLPVAMTEAAYEGRLQINGAVGACQAEQIAGDALPAGAQIYVDQSTAEVVIAWPAYVASVDPLANAGFEGGNVGGWDFDFVGGAGGSVQVDSATKFAGNYALRYTGARGFGSEGGIELLMENNTKGRVFPQQRVSASFRGMYNPGSHNFGCRYQARFRFYSLPDGAGTMVKEVQGRLVKGRGNNGDWILADVTAVTPDDAQSVGFVEWLASKGAPVWADSAQWDVPVSIGVNVPQDLDLTLKVRDSAGRVAYWNGPLRIISGANDWWFVAGQRATALIGSNALASVSLFNKAPNVGSGVNGLIRCNDRLIVLDGAARQIEIIDPTDPVGGIVPVVVTIPGAGSINRIRHCGANTLFAIAPSNYYVSTDGGHNWAGPYTLTSGTMVDVLRFDNGRWVGAKADGASSGFMYSDAALPTAGADWTNSTTTPTNNICMVKSGPNEAVSNGWGSVMYRTTTGGTWVSYGSIPFPEGSNQAAASDGAGAVLWATDGGVAYRRPGDAGWTLVDNQYHPSVDYYSGRWVLTYQNYIPNEGKLCKYATDVAGTWTELASTPWGSMGSSENIFVRHTGEAL